VAILGKAVPLQVPPPLPHNAEYYHRLAAQYRHALEQARQYLAVIARDRYTREDCRIEAETGVAYCDEVLEELEA